MLIRSIKKISKILKVDKARLMEEKLLLLDYAIRHLNIRSFVDLGGVWNIDGGYTFYTLDKGKIERAFLIDTDFTDRVTKRHKKYAQLNIAKGNFGDTEVLKRIGSVDSVFLFDVLLHQVKPDWDEVIRMYAPHTKYFVIYNPQYRGEATIRLLDLGKDEYFTNVPKEYKSNIYRDIFDHLDEIHPTHNRAYRDIHNIWQWGITDRDMVVVMRDVGFIQLYYINYGRWGHLKNFEGHSFIFGHKDAISIVSG